MLRKFEAGVAGNGSLRNLTARGVPATTEDGASGRLYYEIPVLRVLEREISSFNDLQKSLAQLGFNGGNVLMRLSFRRTEEPIEEAMVKIGEYFKSSGEDIPAPAAAQAPGLETVAEKSSEFPQDSASSAELNPSSESTTPPSTTQDTPVPAAPSEQVTSISGRAITVFSPSSETTPLSAQMAYNEQDYVPSIEHAKAHQRQLNQSSRPQRLPTDAEIAAKAAAEEKRRAEIHEVDVKVRFPDQSQVVTKFGPSDSGQTLYGFVRSCLVPELSREKFIINVFLTAAPARAANANVIPECTESLLIKDLGLSGRVLVNFTWTDAASSAARQRQTNLLRPELRSQAREHKVEEPMEPAEDPSESTSQAGPSGAQAGSKPGGVRKGGGMPKWLKLPGKK